MKIFSADQTDESIFDRISERKFIEGDYEDENLDDNCPNCGREYDEIDYEYQICHICRYDNTKP